VGGQKPEGFGVRARLRLAECREQKASEGQRVGRLQASELGLAFGSSLGLRAELGTVRVREKVKTDTAIMFGVSQHPG
jgi:hypothetical protein